MKLRGDDEGIAALKALREANPSALKFLIEEARTNTDLTAQHRAEDGTLYLLRLDPHSGDLVVERAENQRPSRLPGGG